MPLYKTIYHDSATQIFVWKITESLQQLKMQVSLNEKSSLRISGMKSELHQRGFLSIRKLLETAGYTDFDLFYDINGKPHLKDGKHISISHSHEFSTIILSDKNTGIDLELQRDKIIRIADKFIEKEYSFLDKENTSDYIKKLTVIWGIKEAIFKFQNEEGISFKDHIVVNPFQLQDTATAAILNFKNHTKEFIINFLEFDGFALVYAFENQQ